MCNAYNLKTRMAAIGEALDRQLGLALVLAPGVTAETSNLPVHQSVYPRRDGLILRPADPAAPVGVEPALAWWNLTPFFHKGGLKAWKASTASVMWLNLNRVPIDMACPKIWTILAGRMVVAGEW